MFFALSDGAKLWLKGLWPSYREPEPGARQPEPPPEARKAESREKPRQAFERKRAQCAGLRERLLQQPGLPGAPSFEAKRAQLLARAKAEPVLFVETPKYAPTKSGGLKYLRDKLQNSSNSYAVLLKQLGRFRQIPKWGRDALLRDGYLYTENANLAFAFVERLRAHHLFNSEQIWIQRGVHTFHARRNDKGHYVYTDGPEQGLPVTLIHLDRLGDEEPPPPPLHRALRPLKYREKFEQMRITHVLSDHIVAELRYADLWIPSVLKSDGASLSLECQLVDWDQRDRLERARERFSRKQAVDQALRKAIAQQIRERLPFDEPKTEVGQQDGRLRQAWRWAYLHGRKTFRFNDDRYRVYNSNGDPIVPQVCIDYLQDTIERASGTWFAPLGQEPKKRVGGFDFGRAEDHTMRGTWRFVEYAAEHPEQFEVIGIPERERIELGYKPRFFNYLAKTAERYEPFDIAVIRGMAPWDDLEEHTHTVFIYETDPITMMPTLITGNPGYPRIGTWEDEARRTPNRTFRMILRPRLEWLESILIPLDQAAVDQAPPVVVAAD